MGDSEFPVEKQLLATGNHSLLPLIVGTALFMQTLDATIIATALPSMARSVGEDPVRLNLAITAYLLSAAVFIPISGWAVERFGARNVFRAAIGLFALSSALCGVANSLAELVGARMLQGIGGAMMLPVGRTLVLRSVPKTEIVRAMSTLTTPTILGPVLGPPIGGLIVTYFSWHWIFFINVPIGVIGFALVTLYVKKEPLTAPPRLDIGGFILSGLAMAALVLGLEFVGRPLLPWGVAPSLIGGGLLCGGLYINRARRISHPILDPALLRIPTFWAATVGGGICRISLGAMPFLLAMLLQVGFGLSPLLAGLLTFASAAGALASKAAIRPATRLLGFRSMLIGMLVVHAVSLIGYGLFQVSTPHAVIIIALLFGGFFRSLLFTTLNTFTYADVERAAMSHASALTGVTTQLSMSFGVALAALLLTAAVRLDGNQVLKAEDISGAFYAIGVMSLLALIFFLPLPSNAGAQMSGYDRGQRRAQRANGSLCRRDWLL